MDPNLERTFSYPNSDQFTGQPNSTPTQNGENGEESVAPRKTVTIMDVLANSKKDLGDAQTIRTYQSDIADTIKNDNVSMIKVALSEKKRQERRGQLDNTLDDGKKNLYVVVGLAFAFLVIAGLIAGYMYMQSQTTNRGDQVEQQKVQPLLFTETTSVLNIDQFELGDLFKIIERDKEAVMELGDMKSIVLTVGSSTSERQLTSAEFFTIINSRAPDGLVRALGANYSLGVYAFTPREMFAIFKVSSYDTAFAGMLEWEPSIESDIGDIFINKRDRVSTSLNNISSTQAPNTPQGDNLSTTGDATSGAGSPFGIFSQRRFVDKVLSNKDARVLVDTNGREAMLYTFIDKETLVIATSEKSLKEIIFRLTTGRIVR